MSTLAVVVEGASGLLSLTWKIASNARYFTQLPRRAALAALSIPLTQGYGRPHIARKGRIGDKA